MRSFLTRVVLANIFEANLSLAFARLGYKSGILDVDIFGPSIPTLFNLSGEPRLSERMYTDPCALNYC